VAIEGGSRRRQQKSDEHPETKNLDMPFDGKRMIFGGLELIFDAAPAKG
jgi:uncharacterized protein YbaA (DUF1428 family)